jgi:NAD(P)-dependent dehydrogenase (short-subunit alcohol dehydrogenase family)
MRLKDKVAIVTGGAHGMGAAEARLFGKEGAAVVIDVLQKEDEAVAGDICTNQGRAMFVKTDVTSEAAWNHLIATTIATYGQLDILVNNAGRCVRQPGLDEPGSRAFNWGAVGSTDFRPK